MGQNPTQTEEWAVRETLLEMVPGPSLQKQDEQVMDRPKTHELAFQQEGTQWWVLYDQTGKYISLVNVKGIGDWTAQVLLCHAKAHGL